MTERGSGQVIAFARNTDPETSHWAAEAVSEKLRKLQVAVLRYAASVPTFTDLQMGEHFACHGSTYRTRRSELVAKGAIEDTGLRLVVGGGGRKHIAWRITAKGRSLLAMESSGPEAA